MNLSLNLGWGMTWNVDMERRANGYDSQPHPVADLKPKWSQACPNSLKKKKSVKEVENTLKKKQVIIGKS